MFTVWKLDRHNLVVVVLRNLGWPVAWGLAACVGFYSLIHAGRIDNELVRRYFAGHPVEYVEAAMFFVGLAALVLRGLNIVGQFGSLHRVELPPAPPAGQKVEGAAPLLESLDALPRHVRNSYLGRRLGDALKHVVRKGTPDGLDEELKYLSDLDAARQHEGYALVRIITWATPMLGFLGTVIGITLALGDLSPEALVNSPEDAMQGLLAGLSVAFDTTALALSLSIILMFIQFMTNQVESELLSAVDTRTTSEMVGRFQEMGTRTDPQLASIRRMVEAVVTSTEHLVQRQADLWEQTIRAAHEQWAQTMVTAGGQLQSGLSEALQHSVQEHAAELSKNVEVAQERSERLWDRLVRALSENAQVMRAQQTELARQGDVMLRAVQATGEVMQLENSLNRNLQALAGAKNFEDTVMSLSAAIHLLNSRLSENPGAARPVSLRASSDEERAA